jgi:hypothetical protein
MVHGIDSSTGKPAITYVGEKPWHEISPQRQLRFCHFALGLRSLTDVHEDCGIGNGRGFPAFLQPPYRSRVV